MVLDSDMSATEWLFQTHEKLLSFFTFGDTAYLRGGNPYKALQFKMAYYSFMRVQEVYTMTVQI